MLQTDLSRWDYKHQVLAGDRVPPWRVIAWMKFIEAVVQLRPSSLHRLFFHPDRGFRAAMRWYYGIGRRVWVYEVWNWLFTDRRTTQGPSVKEYWSSHVHSGPRPAQQPGMRRVARMPSTLQSLPAPSLTIR